ncbi:MAG: HprK-related kinase B, partial [Desulfonatronovibrionaceae bacterium]
EIRRFSSLDPEELWNLEYKYDVFLDQCFGPDRFRLHSKAHGLVILNWTRSSEPVRMSRVKLKQRQDLLETVMKSPGVFYLDTHNRKNELSNPDSYIAMFADCPVYEISGGVDFPRASELCQKLIN